jgi:hypothetical protein
VIVVGVVLEAFAALIALLVINWGSSTSCREPATMSTVRDGEFGLVVATCVGLVPWALAMIASPRRIRLGVAGAFAVSPLLVGMIAGLDPTFWTHGWCF